LHTLEKIKYTIGVIRSRKSQDRQHNDQKKKAQRTNNDLQNTTQKKKQQKKRATRTQLIMTICSNNEFRHCILCKTIRTPTE
jgi:hypothetical protein